MPKRKREEDGGDVEEQPRAKLSVRQKRVRFKIDGGTKSLAKAFKLAKGFERQKLGRRMKTAHADNNQKDVSRIDEEIKALKALEPTRPAQLHLFKSLMRIKAVAQHPNLPDEVRTPGVLATDTATLNVNARLCNSNPVQKGLKETLRDIQLALGVDVEGGEAGKKQRIRAKDLQSKDGLAERGKKIKKDSQQPRLNGSEVEDSVSGDKGPEKLPGTRSGRSNELDLDAGDELDDADLAQYDDRLASSEDEDDMASHDINNGHVKADDSDEEGEDHDEDDIEALEARLASEGVKPSKSKIKPQPIRSTTKPTQPTPYSLEDDLSSSGDDDSDNDSAAPEPRKAASAAPPPPMTTKSSFIPSLTLGGYMSGSGSDIEDDWDAGPGGAQALRKNRRGQRARQAIWEKKFGTRANHLSKTEARDGKKGSAERGGERDRGWDAKRGATDGRERRNGGGFRGGNSGSGAGGYGRGGRSRGGDGARGNAAPQRGGNAKAKSRDDSGPIHPSWEAAKRAKEKKEAPVAFAGKKITFD